MKLNLGCGGDHKKGYLNVDAFDDTIADKIMNATNLELNDNTVEEILMSQVIEHFGIAQSIYVLSECFRVLQRGEKLIIETPDIRESFKIYLNGIREDRKNILPWIYGVDIPGMQHRFCFPEDLLDEELKKIGFTNIKKDYLKFDEYQPILRVTCEKPSEIDEFQIITILRKKLLKNGEINLDEQINALEKEKLIEFFTEELKKFFQKKDNKIFKKILLEGVIKSPKITLIFLKILIDQKLISEEIGKKYIEILKRLDDINFIDILLDNLSSRSNFIGKQDELFETVNNFGKEIVEKLLVGSEIEQEDIIKNLKEERKTDAKYEIDFLSQKLVMLKAYRVFQIGVKEFNKSNYKEAIKYFKESSFLFRDQILTYWNLGRLYMLTHDENMAKTYYKNAIKLLDIIRFDRSKEIKELLELEMNKNQLVNYDESLISLRQVCETMN